VTNRLVARAAQFKRDSILDAAIAVFASKGFHASSMREVAAEAGVAPGSIYNHFESKAALLLAIFDRMAESAQALPPPPGASPRALLAAAIEAPIAVVTGQTEALFRVILTEVLVNGEMAAAFRDRVLNPLLAVARGPLLELCPHAGREAWLSLVTAVMLGLLLQRLLDPEAPSPPAGELADALLAGAGA
jgi:AcrR family transcriptional regulator